MAAVFTDSATSWVSSLASMSTTFPQRIRTLRKNLTLLAVLAQIEPVIAGPTAARHPTWITADIGEPPANYEVAVKVLYATTSTPTSGRLRPGWR